MTITYRTQAPTSLTAMPQLVILPPSVGLGRVSATLTSGEAPVAGEAISFSVGATPLCTAPTASTGTASCTLNVAQELDVLFADGYQASFAGDSAFMASSDSAPAIELGSAAKLADADRARLQARPQSLSG